VGKARAVVVFILIPDNVGDVLDPGNIDEEGKTDFWNLLEDKGKAWLRQAKVLLPLAGNPV